MAGRAGPARRAGFTLLEILVTMVLIGIIMSFALLAIRGGSAGEQLEEETRRLHALMRLARDEAVVQSRELALVVRETGYEFQVLGEEEWAGVEGDRLLRARDFPEGTEVELVIEELPVDLEAQEEQQPPRIFVFSSGEMTPFEISLRVEDEGPGFYLRGNLLGELEIEGPVE